MKRKSELRSGPFGFPFFFFLVRIRTLDPPSSGFCSLWRWPQTVEERNNLFTNNHQTAADLISRAVRTEKTLL